MIKWLYALGFVLTFGLFLDSLGHPVWDGFRYQWGLLVAAEHAGLRAADFFGIAQAQAYWLDKRWGVK